MFAIYPHYQPNASSCLFAPLNFYHRTAAHADSLQTAAFVEALAPPCIILVHGERGEMRRLKDGLSKKFEGGGGEGVSGPDAQVYVFGCVVSQLLGLGGGG